MYYIHTTYPIMRGEPHLGSVVESDRIEADGEAEAIFLDNCQHWGYAERHFTAIDDISEYDIELDIVDYIGEKAFNAFAGTFIYADEDEELSRTKINSRYIACLKANR